MTYNPRIHHRRSIRLKGYDYTQPGAYFVTIVTHQRNEIFGQVIHGEMKLSALGEIVHHEWVQSGGIRKEIKLFEDEFVVMPNHIHGIVWIVETTNDLKITDTNSKIDIHLAPKPKLQRMPKSLGSYIAGFKSKVSSRAKHELSMAGIWQRNYYEHIIRNETSFKNIWNYIDNNPHNWAKDQLSPSALPNKFNQE